MGRKTFRHVITSPELIAQINKDNTDIINKFLKEKSTRSSAMTISSYHSDLNIFMVWNLLNNDNKFFVNIKKLELANFFSFVTDELQWGSSRANRLRSTLSSLSIFLEKFFDSEFPAFKNIVLKTIESVPKNERREKTILSNEQVESVLQYFYEKDCQIACWFALAAFSGSRFSELLRFDVDILDENHTAFGDLFMVTRRMIRTKGRGKSGKMLLKYILKEQFIPYYKKWITQREKILKEKNLEHNSLFIKRDGTPANEGTARAWIGQIETFLGVPTYPHALRHYLTTFLSRKNIPAAFIKDLFGWAGTQMVDLYSDLTFTDTNWKELENLK